MARRKCFENTSIHSMNLPIKVQQRRAELSSASIDDCCLTQLQREEDFIYGTRTMNTVISSVKHQALLGRGNSFLFRS